MSAKHTVGQFMTRHPYTIGADQPISLAHRMMSTHNVRHLPVLSGGKLVGMVSERDLAVIEATRRLDVDQATVDKAMTADPYLVTADTALVEVARQMATSRHGSAVVVEDDTVVGIFTTVDALQALLRVLAPEPKQRTKAAAAGGAGGG